MTTKLRNQRVTWVVVDEAGSSVCQRCGARELCLLPMTIEAFVQWSNYVLEKHKGCKQKEQSN